MAPYWLFDWLDEHEIRSKEGAKLLFANPVAVKDLRDRATKAIEAYGASLPFAGAPTSIVAGRGIDLSGQLDCLHPACRRAQVETLFNRVWHYFDSIVVQDAVAHEVSVHRDDAPSEKRTEWILFHVEVALYVREIKAESLLDFRMRPPACLKHLKRHAGEAKLSRALQGSRELALELAKSAEVVLDFKNDGGVSYAVSHPDFVHTRWGTISKSDAQGEDSNKLRLLALQSEIKEFLAYLNSDVLTARGSGSPLGAVIPLHERLLQRGQSPSAADVAFHLELPVLNGLPTETLIKLRRDEHDYFARFQRSLRQAIDERIRTSNSENARSIAEEIRRDLIDPELEKIHERLVASERTLVKKTAVGTFLGAIATTCGLLCGAPAALAISGGVAAAIGTTSTAAAKHLDDKNDLSLSDMYFIWKAVTHTNSK